ncbi:serine proteinase stubble-like [Lytechinus variegatus]|uniref:serine proteinase stubble-like n=1 Tax=Lytechinus variegatus TaxID=7654 RepID=UPI001BB255D8|nr:serine proteinase stubble-like [Lytechinus variegatus]
MNWKRTSGSYNFNEAFVLGETIQKGKHEETIKERSESLSSVEDDGPVANPRGLPTKAASIDFGVDDDVDGGKPLRNCFMGCFVVFVVLAMMTCVGILLYFILINTVFVDSDSRTLTGPLTVEGSLLLNETYHPDLADPESTAYREMENEFTSAMSGSFGNSSLADIYDRTRVERFEQGSIRIIFTVFLSSAPNDAVSEMEVIVDVQVTVGNGISSGFFDAFEILEDSLEFTSVNQQSQTTVRPPITAFVESTPETTAIHSVTSQVISSLSTLFSTPITSVGTVAPTTIPITTRGFSSQAPAFPTTKVITMSPQSITSSPPPSTSEVAATASTMIDDTTGTDHRTAQSFPTDSQTVGTNLANLTSVSPTTVNNLSIPPSTVDATITSPVIQSTTSSTEADHSTRTFNGTSTLTSLPVSSDTTSPSITRTVSSMLTTEATTATVSPTNSSLTTLTTASQRSTDPATQTTADGSTSSNTNTRSSSSTTSGMEANVTRQPKIHPALPDTCGAPSALNDSTTGGTARIVGGTLAPNGKWPWMGSLRSGRSHQCGAVLIHQEWAITAAHCVGFFDNIVLGDNDLAGTTDTSPYRVERNIQHFSNPDFNPVNDDGDIALVRLTEPVEFNDYVQPLCINTLTTEMTSFNNCFVSGWGTDDIDVQASMRYLMDANIQMFNRSICSQWYTDIHAITNQHICAGEENGRRDSCSGDSGGPLQCQDDQGIWYLLGVVSFGQGCGEERLPGVYTRISTQISFLQGILDTNLKS